MPAEGERSPSPAMIPFGTVGRAFGKDGEVMFRPYNSASRWPSGLESVVLVSAHGERAGRVVGSRAVPGGEALRFEGVTNREQASALTLQEIRVPRTALPPLGPGEFFIEDLPGCTVVDVGGHALGLVVGTFWNGAQDVMTVRAENGRELLIPVVPAHVSTVDFGRGCVTVDWTEEEG